MIRPRDECRLLTGFKITVLKLMTYYWPTAQKIL